MGFFIFLTYILSSWFSWYYGASYGLRAYIDYFTLFFIPFAVFLNESGRFLKGSVIALSILTVPLNVIQTYQYRHYILHNSGMNMEKYWRVFLRTNRQFMGLLYKTPLRMEDYEQVDERTAADFRVLPGQEKVIFQARSSDIEDFGEVCLVRVSLENDFR